MSSFLSGAASRRGKRGRESGNTYQKLIATTGTIKQKQLQHHTGQRVARQPTLTDTVIGTYESKGLVIQGGMAAYDHTMGTNPDGRDVPLGSGGDKGNTLAEPPFPITHNGPGYLEFRDPLSIPRVRGNTTFGDDVHVNGTLYANKLEALTTTLQGATIDGDFDVTGTISAPQVDADNFQGGAFNGDTVNATTINSTTLNTTDLNATGLGTLASINTTGNANITGNLTIGGTLTVDAISAEYTTTQEEPILRDTGGGIGAINAANSSGYFTDGNAFSMYTFHWEGTIGGLNLGESLYIQTPFSPSGADQSRVTFALQTNNILLPQIGTQPTIKWETTGEMTLAWRSTVNRDGLTIKADDIGTGTFSVSGWLLSPKLFSASNPGTSAETISVLPVLRTEPASGASARTDSQSSGYYITAPSFRAYYYHWVGTLGSMTGTNQLVIETPTLAGITPDQERTRFPVIPARVYTEVLGDEPYAIWEDDLVKLSYSSSVMDHQGPLTAANMDPSSGVSISGFVYQPIEFTPVGGAGDIAGALDYTKPEQVIGCTIGDGTNDFTGVISNCWWERQRVHHVLYIDISWTGLGSASGPVKIGFLPASCGLDHAASVAVNDIENIMVNTHHHVSARIPAGSSFIDLWETHFKSGGASGGDHQPLDVSELRSTGSIKFTIAYNS